MGPYFAEHSINPRDGHIDRPEPYPHFTCDCRNLLRVTRAIIYMDDPHMERPDGFLNDPSHPSHIQMSKLWEAYVEAMTCFPSPTPPHSNVH